MKVLLFSDVHGHPFQQHSIQTENGINSRLEDALNVLDDVTQMVEELGINVVLFGGDLFHLRDPIHVHPFNLIVQKMIRMREKTDRLVILVGNHDQTNRTGDINSLSTLSTFADVIQEPSHLRINQSLSVYGIPYTDNKEKIVQFFSQFSKEAEKQRIPSVLLGHFGISGAEVGSDIVLFNSKIPSLDDLDSPDNFSQIFLGHYHKPQKLLDNFRYIGATHHHRWSDVGQERGVWVWRVGDETIPKFVPLTSAPKFVKVSGDDPVFDEHQFRGNFVRFVFDSEITRSKWEDLRNIATQWGVRWVDYVVQDKGQLPSISDERSIVGVDVESTLKTYAQRFCGELDAEVLLKLGAEFYEKASING